VQVIPVIDVRHGVAVKAVAGDRASYRPLVTPLAASPAPEAVAAGLMALHRFAVIYVADLDGIEGRSADAALAARVADATGVSGPAAGVWLDSGAADIGAVEAALAEPRVSAVLGSEVGWTPQQLSKLPEPMRRRVILSFDFRGTRFVGDAGLLDASACWPQRIIVMTLASVGRGEGPDYERLAQVLAKAGSRQVFAAGGVRHRRDLDRLAAMGVSGALVASALHAGTITADDLG